MENQAVRALIMQIGGNSRPGEGINGYLYRVFKETGLKPRTLKAWWYGESIPSQDNRTKLEKAADNANNLASRLEALANDAEMAGRPRREVDELRATALRLRGHDLSTGTANDRET